MRTDVYHDLVFALNCIRFHSIHISTHTIHAEQKKLISFTLEDKLYAFSLIFFTLSGTHT